MTFVPKTHPRYLSLKIRDIVVNGADKGITSLHGLLAHGRGEAFDYFIGERTTAAARKAIRQAAFLLKEAEHPVISVNGNFAALCAKDIVRLARAAGARIEVNIFHSSREREKRIRGWLLKAGAAEVLMPQKGFKAKYIESNRKYVNRNGIYKADVVFVPLEDGDRTEALVKDGKKVITVDLNPMSRTAVKATVSIVDNIVRAMPLLLKELKKQLKPQDYDNHAVLRDSREIMSKRLLKIKNI